MRRQGRVGMRFLVGITFGTFGLVRYSRTNRLLASGLGVSCVADSRLWSQIIPIFNLVCIHESARRINDFAGRKVISPVATWLIWSWFFQGSYMHLQGGVNRACDLRGVSR